MADWKGFSYPLRVRMRQIYGDDAIDKRVLRRSLLSLENLNCQVIVSRSGIVGQFQIRVDIPVERLLPLSYHGSPNQRIGSGIRENSRYS